MRTIVKIWGAWTAAIAVALGAFGAHAWKASLLAMQRMDTFETATKYQMYAGLGLLMAGHLGSDGPWAKWAWRALVLGSLVFPGTLYLLIGTGQTFWGAITPIGGLGLILGFVFLAIDLKKSA